jgi:hypothetical protein
MRMPSTVLMNPNGGARALPPRNRAGAWARARRASVELTADAIEQIAQRVAELLREDTEERHRDRGGGLIDATQLAQRLGVSREWVYEHANELGAVTLGSGTRPRLRFDLEVAVRVVEGRRRGTPPGPPPAQPRPTRRRRRQPASSDVPLLPVYEPRGRGLLARFAKARRRGR